MEVGLKNVFWIAGESSGDLHSSMVIKRLNERGKKFNHIGIGGYRMQEQGFKALFPFKKFSQMGFGEVLSKLPFLLKTELEIKKLFINIKPEIVVLVDFPGFNLRIAKIAYELNIPVLYYICPQFWAWRHSRVCKLEADTNIVACILPFEKELLDINRVNSTYVGHPIAEEIEIQVSREKFALTFGLNPEKDWLGFMPGSRNNEVVKVLPAFIDAISRFNQDEYEFLISKSHSVKNDVFWKYIPDKKKLPVTVIDGYIYEMIQYSRFIAVTSGTATLEVAYLGTPSIIVYKTSRLSYEIAKKLIRVNKIGLPNIILENEVIPELIQGDVNGENIHNKIQHYLSDTSEYNAMKQELLRVKETLKEKSASNEVADLIERYIKD